MPKTPRQAIRGQQGAVAPRSAEFWRARICDVLPGLSIDWLVDGAIQAKVSAWRFADAGIVEIEDPPIQVARHVRPGSVDRGYKVALHLAGHGHYRWSGNEFFQAPGDIVLLDTELSFEVAHPAGAHVLIWELPRNELGWLLGRPEGCRLIRGCEGIGPILSAYMQMLAREAERLTPEAQQFLHTHLCRLVAFALGTAPGARRETHRVARRTVQRQRILAYIESHLGDPQITAEGAARDLSMSRRWLHALLDESGEGFSARLTRRRIEESCRLLHDPAFDHLSISEIGFLVGFNDTSTFHRRFRRHCVTTPNQLRRSRSEERRLRSTA